MRRDKHCLGISSAWEAILATGGSLIHIPGLNRSFQKLSNDPAFLKLFENA